MFSTHRWGNSGPEELSNSVPGHTAPSRKTRLLVQVGLTPELMSLPPPLTKEKRSQTLPGALGLNLKQLPKQAITASRKQGSGREELVASGALNTTRNVVVETQPYRDRSHDPVWAEVWHRRSGQAPHGTSVSSIHCRAPKDP